MTSGIDREKFKKALRLMNQSHRHSKGVNMYIPGKNEELKKEFIRKKMAQRAESTIPCSILNEITFIMLLLACALIAVLYFCISLTLLGWKSSIQSIAEPKREINGSSSDPYAYDMLNENNYDSRFWSIYYFILSITLLLMSLIPMWYAGIHGRKNWIIWTCSIHALVLWLEIFGWNHGRLKIPPSCNTGPFEASLKDQIKWYGILGIHKENRGHSAMEKINAVQLSLGCCGIEGYEDYATLFKTETDTGFDRSWYPDVIKFRPDTPAMDADYYVKNGRDIRQIPLSCCKPIWRYNIYCADDMFEIEKRLEAKGMGKNYLSKHRLNQKGCAEAVKQVCEQFRILLTEGMMYLLIVRAILYLLILIFSGIIYSSVHFMQKMWLARSGVRKYEETLEKGQQKSGSNVSTATKPQKRVSFISSLSSDSAEEADASVPISSLFTIGELEEPAHQEVLNFQRNLEETVGRPLYFGPQANAFMTHQEYYDSMQYSRVEDPEGSRGDNLYDLPAEDFARESKFYRPSIVSSKIRPVNSSVMKKLAKHTQAKQESKENEDSEIENEDALDRQYLDVMKKLVKVHDSEQQHMSSPNLLEKEASEEEPHQEEEIKTFEWNTKVKPEAIPRKSEEKVPPSKHKKWHKALKHLKKDKSQRRWELYIHPTSPQYEPSIFPPNIVENRTPEPGSGPPLKPSSSGEGPSPKNENATLNIPDASKHPRGASTTVAPNIPDASKHPRGVSTVKPEAVQQARPPAATESLPPSALKPAVAKENLTGAGDKDRGLVSPTPTNIKKTFVSSNPATTPKYSTHESRKMKEKGKGKKKQKEKSKKKKKSPRNSKNN